MKEPQGKRIFKKEDIGKGKLVLLVLDERASVKDIAKVIGDFSYIMSIKYPNEEYGMCLISNNKVIERSKEQLREVVDFYKHDPRKRESTYNQAIEEVLGTNDIYMIIEQGNRWSFEQTTRDRVEVIEVNGGIDVVPKR